MKNNIIFFLVLLFCISYSIPPSKLPGEELTDEEYFYFKVPQDTVLSKVPHNSPYSETWLEKATKTWDAPSPGKQLNQDIKNIKMGMGAIFIPRMSEEPDLEPEIEIYNANGKLIKTGSVSKKYNVLPGKYYVLIGSGSHKQKIVKECIVKEGEIKIIMPTWSGLQIDIYDEDYQPFRGEYELARIDQFEPYGRGTGRNEELGEKVKTWILKPGIYKIFGVGESYNSLKNFVTVRLLPGELTHFILVQNKTTLSILGGGIATQNQAVVKKKKWNYGIDMGGGIDINYSNDQLNDSTTFKNNFSFLTTLKLKYKNTPFEHETRIKIDEGFSMNEFDFTTISSNFDEFYISNIFTVKILSWLGPYARGEYLTGIMPARIQRPDKDILINQNHYFIKFSEKPDTITDSSHYEIDSISSSIRTQPSFSPNILETGIGGNLNILKNRYIESKLLIGLGLTFEKARKEYKIFTDNQLNFDTLSNFYTLYIKNKSHNIFVKNNEQRFEIGPEFLFNTILYIGKIATLEEELKYFAPFYRFTSPDINLKSILSWKITRMVTLDYEYKFTLVQTTQEELRQKDSHHRVLIRFSFSAW